ncbi:hypothetical protein Tco_1323689 [Tanacetum coccineum]
MASSGSSDITKSSEGSQGWRSHEGKKKSKGKAKSKKRLLFIRKEEKGTTTGKLSHDTLQRKRMDKKQATLAKSPPDHPKDKSGLDAFAKLTWAKLNKRFGDADLSKDKSGPKPRPEFRRSWYVEGHVKSGVISSVLAQ